MTTLSKELTAEANTKMRNISPLCGVALDLRWPMVWEAMQASPALLRLYDERYCYIAAIKGHWQVWVYSDTEIRGIVVTKINVFPKCKVLDVMLISGISGLQFMEELEAVFEILARQQECAHISVSVEPALERIVLRKFRGTRFYSVVTRPVGLLARSS